MIYQAVTQGIRVSVRPVYMREHSRPQDQTYVWAYEVVIENLSGESVQLLNRFWQIIDAEGTIKEVRGSGVVGAQPKIESGKKYTYSSFTILPTPSGRMSGAYEMVSSSGDAFEIDIPEFLLEFPCRLVTPEVSSNVN